ncbi:hypothetical protein ACJX0J_006133, partial [Zea mays]
LEGAELSLDVDHIMDKQPDEEEPRASKAFSMAQSIRDDQHIVFKAYQHLISIDQY